MSILEIKNNIDNLDKKSNEELIRYIHELFMKDKRNESKIMSLKAEIAYMTRHMKKIVNLIENMLKTNVNEGDVWKEKK